MSSAEYQREWYQKNKVKHVARVNERRGKYRKEVQDFIREAKSDPCMDCQVSFPPYVMDFDHRPGEEKLMNVGTAGSLRWSLRQLQEEIAKCDLVCSNCHRERTHQRRLLSETGIAQR
jgi:hypothetical protein